MRRLKLTLVFVLVLMSQKCLASHYISNISVPVLDGTGGVVPVVVTAALDNWVADGLDYDGDFTSPGGIGFDHSHALKDFPVQGVANGVTMTVTSDMVDAVYHQTFPLETIISPSTTAMNCHGYTTVKNFWISTAFLGVGYVLGQEYVSSLNYNSAVKYVFANGGTIFSNRTHSYKQICQPSYFGTLLVWTPVWIVEKFNVGPYFKASSTGSTVSSWNKYDRHP